MIIDLTIQELEGFLGNWRKEMKLSVLCVNLFFSRTQQLSSMELEAILSFLFFEWLPSPNSLFPSS
jgi:hypothetical protein